MYILPYTGVSLYRIENSFIDFPLGHSDLGVCVDKTLRFHTHIRKNAGILNGMTNSILSCTLNNDTDFIMNIYVF